MKALPTTPPDWTAVSIATFYRFQLRSCSVTEMCVRLQYFWYRLRPIRSDLKWMCKEFAETYVRVVVVTTISAFVYIGEDYPWA